MESNWATEHLQVIRTLMERSALYRRALAPIMLTIGVIGVAAGVVGRVLQIESPPHFAGYWMGVSLLALLAAFLLVRRQALKDAEPFWSSPTRRVAQAIAPPLFIGMVAGVGVLACPGWDFIRPWNLPLLWMLLYGCALHAAGFFMPRGIRLFGWVFVLVGCGLAACRCWAGGPLVLPQGHVLMGTMFGGAHLAYGCYLYITEKQKRAA
jgi:hypothetical protein